MYIFSLFTKALHLFPGELSHYIALSGLKLLHSCGLLRFLNTGLKINSGDIERDIRKLYNKVGIAAGLDKNGDYIDCLAALGISFIEVGTVTPKPQKGNPKPRIFRNIKKRSLLNRLGFNNKGVDYLVNQLKNKKTQIIIGSSIGKNFDTPNEKASDDYIYCLNRVYGYSDYVAINISSPNTKDLRELSKEQYLNLLLHDIKLAQTRLSEIHGYKPVFVKISPDESYDALNAICNCILKNKLDGIICTNTTSNHDNSNGAGGLSGTPLKKKSTEILNYVKTLVGEQIKVIASGGVMTPLDYQEKIDNGADLVQIYTGFIYEGPKLIQDILNLEPPQ